MITSKERAQILLTQAELERRRDRARLWRRSLATYAIALGCLVSLATGARNLGKFETADEASAAYESARLAVLRAA